MNKEKLKKTLTEIEEVVKTMNENIENEQLLKFFTGKLSLLAKEVASYLIEYN